MENAPSHVCPALFIALKNAKYTSDLNPSQKHFFEDNILDILVLAALSLDGKLQCLRFANSWAGDVKLAMGEYVGAEPNSNVFQCLTLKSELNI